MTNSIFDAKLPVMEQGTGRQSIWGNCSAGALPFAIAKAASAHEGMTLVVTPDHTSAEQLMRALTFYTTGQNLPLLRFPDWETLIYEHLSPHSDIVSERLRILHQLLTAPTGILVVAVPMLMQRLPPRQWIAGQSFHFSVGDLLEMETQKRLLQDMGYSCVNTIYEHGEYAVRGSLLDIFPMGSKMPIRIDLLGDEIASLRTFDPDSQRTISEIQTIQCLPAREMPLTSAGIEQFKKKWHESFDVDVRKCSLYQDLSRGFSAPGSEYYLPLFFEQTSLLLDYMPENVCLIMTDTPAKRAEQFHREIKERYENLKHDRTHPVLPPNDLFLPPDGLFKRLGELPRIKVSKALQKSGPRVFNFSTAELPEVTFDMHAVQPAEKLIAFLGNYKGRVLFCAESLGRRETLMTLLRTAHITPTAFDKFDDFIESEVSLGIVVGNLDDGMALITPRLTVFAERQLFGGQVTQRRRRQRSKQDPGQIIQDLIELKPGDAVVHIEHGVGRYQELQTLKVDGREAEFLTLLYGNDAKLYVPVASLHMISRYAGFNPDLAPLHRLGSEQWKKAHRKAALKARDTAAELLDIYARRAAQTGFAHQLSNMDYQRFCVQFPFEETPDQVSAIEAIQADMQAPHPMDRLICGDVGFGKTEVAMRAAFISVMSGKQVTVIAPTTLLAQQHYDTFQDRFADWPVHIGILSRFQTVREITLVKKAMHSGNADIVIGTHKLLQRGIKFKDLGLVVIDEEHRFGVRQKERLKALRTTVDILTLTATPIPRTLNMAIAGVRDLSIIATPPARRLAIKTLVQQHHQGIISEAIQRELLRGGQVYYLHNKVSSIERVALEIAALAPDATVIMGHGQMRERELERVMSDFYHQRAHILVCTTIIETGIDVPNANTIIIERADLFGLAQLHQLRGRVGRSHHQAYAYLLTPHPSSLGTEAEKRLEAIQAASELSAGFTLATHDLEIRGAGALLGEEQSGEIQGVGFSLYTRMLEHAIRRIKEDKTGLLDAPLDLETEPEIDMQLPALIPEQYIPDTHTRLVLYKRMASAPDGEALSDLRSEMIDRFGLLPEPLKILFSITTLKFLARPLGIRRVVAGEKGGRLEFDRKPEIALNVLVKMVQTDSSQYELKNNSHLYFKMNLVDAEKRFAYVQTLLEKITPRSSVRQSI